MLMFVCINAIRQRQRAPFTCSLLFSRLEKRSPYFVRGVYIYFLCLPDDGKDDDEEEEEEEKEEGKGGVMWSSGRVLYVRI